MALFTGASDSTIHNSILSSVARDQFSFFGPINFNIIGEQPHHCQNAEDRKPSLLPPDQVHVDVGVVDVSACVTLRQTFVNPSDIAIGRMKYVFPIPARAAVCAFEMRLQDGRRIIGISKEKVQAARQYEAAVQAGKAAALADWVADDIFIISVGSIPARETVTTILVFVMELDDEPNGGVRLQLPMFIGCRYGLQPSALATAQSVSAQTRLRITVDIQMSGTITGVTSPTHPEIQLIPHTTPDGDARKTVQFESPTFLTQSFVLFVHANGLDSPRCFAELDHRGSGTVAMQLSFVLHIGIAPILPHEYLFLVDRSGSMSGSKMEAVKRALIKIFHLLPKEGTFFNIFSFGGSIRQLWGASKQCNLGSLRDAIAYVHSMDANLGGTELPGALEFVLKHRNSNISSIVFVLTDGEVHTGDEAISVVTNVVARSSPEAPLRVFSFGIGHNVSTAAVEGIARAGNGKSLFAIDTDSIEDKCTMLLGAALPCVKDVMIDWGTPTRSSTPAPNSVRLSDSVFVQFGPFPSVRQSPTRTPDIFTGIRFTVFALATHGIIPKQVILQGTYGDPGRPFMFMVPVSNVKIFGRKELTPLHVLSARHLINDLIEGRATLPETINSANTDDIRRAAIVQLGEQYQLASRYTSFVAVFDETTVLPLSSADNQEAVGSLSQQDSPSEFLRYSIDDVAKLDLRGGSEWSVGEQLQLEEEDMGEEWEPHMKQLDADVVRVGTQRENEQRKMASEEKEIPQPDGTMFPSGVTLCSTRSPSPVPSGIGRATVAPPDIFGQALQAQLSASAVRNAFGSDEREAYIMSTASRASVRYESAARLSSRAAPKIHASKGQERLPSASILRRAGGGEKWERHRMLRAASTSNGEQLSSASIVQNRCGGEEWEQKAAGAQKVHLFKSVFGHTWSKIVSGATFDIVGRNRSKGYGNANNADPLALLLSPILDAMYNSIRSGCMEGTRQEIIGKIDGWINGGSDQRMCWLRGAAGDGKSAIARTIAERCVANKRLAASFFFREAGHQSKITHLISTIAYNLRFSIPATRPYVDSILQQDPYIIQRSLEHQFRTLIVQPLQSVASPRVISLIRRPRPMVVVIDGLDACDDQTMIAEFIGIVAGTFRDLQFPLRFFFTSRVEKHIEKAFSASPVVPATYSLALQDFKTAVDIRIFFRARFSSIYRQNRHLMGSITPPWPSESDLDKLVERTSGSFACAVTLVNFVNDGNDVPHQKLQACLASLDPLYPDTPRSPSVCTPDGC